MQSVKGTIRPDALGEALRGIRFQSTVLCRSELTAPWGFGVVGRDHATFHLVLRGRCCLEVQGQPGLRWLSGGELVVLPHGNAHAMRDAPGSHVTALEDLARGCSTHPLPFLRAGAGGASTVLVCGGLHFEDRATSPLLSALPPVIHLSGRRRGVDAWLRATFDFLAGEAEGGRPGADTVVTRLADVLFIEAIRAHFASPEAESGGLALALRDRRLGAALAAMHRDPGMDWDVGSLARRAAMSRTAFATRFAALVGEPPRRYLTRCRMDKAAALLRTTSASLPEIAEKVGYESELGFARAFERFLGASPAQYRRRLRRSAPRERPRAARS
jgi:AraC-like DNA-binding protein